MFFFPSRGEEKNRKIEKRMSGNSPPPGEEGKRKKETPRVSPLPKKGKRKKNGERRKKKRRWIGNRESSTPREGRKGRREKEEDAPSRREKKQGEGGEKEAKKTNARVNHLPQRRKRGGGRDKAFFTAQELKRWGTREGSSKYGKEGYTGRGDHNLLPLPLSRPREGFGKLSLPLSSLTLSRQTREKGEKKKNRKGALPVFILSPPRQKCERGKKGRGGERGKSGLYKVRREGGPPNLLI